MILETEQDFIFGEYAEHSDSVNGQYRIIPYSSDLADMWEESVASSLTGTLLHTRKFLSYHGDKFDDQSLLIYDHKNIVRAVFPAARDPANSTTVVSHPGITYGGLLHNGWLNGNRCLEALAQLCEYYASAGFKEFIYKPVPLIYHRVPAQDDIYSLFRLRADRYRVDLSATIDLNWCRTATTRRNRSQKKALKCELTISEDYNHMHAYWNILVDNLRSKYGKVPVHSADELTILKEKFPAEIELITASDCSGVLAGSLLFLCPTVVHAQYFASTVSGREKGALDLVVEKAIEKSHRAGKHFFDFGISTDEQGKYLNEGLHTFKCEFGAGGAVYEFYRLKLDKFFRS